MKPHCAPSRTCSSGATSAAPGRRSGGAETAAGEGRDRYSVRLSTGSLTGLHQGTYGLDTDAEVANSAGTEPFAPTPPGLSSSLLTSRARLLAGLPVTKPGRDCRRSECHERT